MPCGVGLSRASGSKSFGVIVCSSGNVENAGQLSVVVPELCKTDNLRSEERSLKVTSDVASKYQEYLNLHLKCILRYT